MTPFTLERGLLIEDKQVVLPWGTSWSALSDVGSPFVTEARADFSFAWRYVRFLGGLYGDVHAKLTRKRPLRELELHVRFQNETAQMTFDRISLHLRSSIGMPTRSETNKFDGYPTEEWSMPPVAIWHSITERFGEYHVMRIRHRGPITRDTQEE